MEPRESGSYSVPSFLSTHRKNLAIILLNLPRDLSTNLNEDSDNQKENVVPNKRFRMVTDEETDRNRANTENIRIGLVFVVLAQ
jgi:hypothetical protein